MADCANCKYLGIDCSPDEDEYMLPCEAYTPILQEEVNPQEEEWEWDQDILSRVPN